MANLFLAQNTRRPIAWTLWITEILKRWLLVAKKVPYKFPHNIPLKLSTLHVVSGQFILAQNTQRPIAWTLWITEILKKWLLVAKKVPYKFPNDIPLQMSTLHVVNGRFIFRQNTETAIARTLHPKKKKKKIAP